MALWIEANSHLEIDLEAAASQATGAGVHIAFSAPDHAAIKRFHAKGLNGGGRDNGAPGLRKDYSPIYFLPRS